MPEFLPCPFCGETYVNKDDIRFVRCASCGAFGPTQYERSAWEAWNTRANPPVVQSSAEEVRQAIREEMAPILERLKAIPDNKWPIGL